MPRYSAFPPPPPLPGTKKAFREVHGRALPPGVRKFLAKPAIPVPPLPAKPSATEARTPSPLAVKTPPYASVPLKKPDEASFFRSKIPVRIPASTTSRQKHRDRDTLKGDDGQHIAAKKTLVESLPKALRARSALPEKFDSRIPVRKITVGRADSASIQLTTESAILPPQSSTVFAKIDAVLIPEVAELSEDGWREEMPQADFLVVIRQEQCSGDNLLGQAQSVVFDAAEEQHPTASEIQLQSAPLQTEQSVDEVMCDPFIQPGDNESMASTSPNFKSENVIPRTRNQKRNIALKERRKAKKKAAKLSVAQVPLSTDTDDSIPADGQELVPALVVPATSDLDVISTASDSIDAQPIYCASENVQVKTKPLNNFEGHPPFLPYVFVMDCIRPFVPRPPAEVTPEVYEEYLHVSNIPYSVSSEEVVAFLEELAGPVKFFSMHLNENGSYSGKASVIFERHTDARKALLLYDGKQIDGRKLKMKLFVNGERLYPNHVTLPNPQKHSDWQKKSSDTQDIDDQVLSVTLATMPTQMAVPPGGKSNMVSTYVRRGPYQKTAPFPGFSLAQWDGHMTIRG
ncbi:hypothetical protein OUZ56_018999 [Daphnia magna]|uniref:RRM domain-containing protein n=1 Tax=Daphnia magna TaxID=35525 RepID=A0ABQ9ZAC4_9CRUS|nr:hypothetical protein OUZ56_018999 [Daphnia magna]